MLMLMLRLVLLIPRLVLMVLMLLLLLLLRILLLMMPLLILLMLMLMQCMGDTYRHREYRRVTLLCCFLFVFSHVMSICDAPIPYVRTAVLLLYAAEIEARSMRYVV